MGLILCENGHFTILLILPVFFFWNCLCNGPYHNVLEFIFFTRGKHSKINHFLVSLLYPYAWYVVVFQEIHDE